MSLSKQSFDISSLLRGYRAGKFAPAEILHEVKRRIALSKGNPIWITVLSDAELLPYLHALDERSPEDAPLYGIPFAIKDNIDLAGIATTAACPDFAYVPTESAAVVAQLIAAGAIPVGKTNLDQFATGLVGTRSPYGACQNSFNPTYISGGSSSGSAVATALGQVSFALGTDTAGSGRVPAGFNNLVGIKPSRGLLSARGMLPACRSIDCMSIFALNSNDAQRLLDLAAGYDAADPFARQPVGQRDELAKRFRFGIPQPEQLDFDGDSEYQRLFEEAVVHLQRIGGEAVTIDFLPFLQAARLLYEGPWVSERYTAIRPFFDQHEESLYPVTRQIIGGGRSPSAADAFAAQYRLLELKRLSESVWDEVDLIVTPTAPRPYTLAEIDEEPVARNSRLGTYTNFMNLLDLSALAIPTGFCANGLPFGVTAFAPAFHDRTLLALAARVEERLQLPLGATRHAAIEGEYSPTTEGFALAVCGAHMEGLPLNHQLTSRGAVFAERLRTSANYRLFALPGGPPQRPGLVRDENNGSTIEVEVWHLPIEMVGRFMGEVPKPLVIGKVELEDGRWVSGFLCEGYPITLAREITELGGWRAYLASH